MSVRVITPPEPFLTPADIPGSHAADDPKVAAMIAAAVEEIDGYTGWLGRCLAPQLIEQAYYEPWPSLLCLLPKCIPLLEVVSVSVPDANDDWVVVNNAVSHADYDRLNLRVAVFWEIFGFMPSRLRVRYWAGYGERDSGGEWVEKVPARVKQAVIMTVQHLKAIGVENLFLRSEQVEGVGTTTYTVSEQAGAIIRDTAHRLLVGLKVPRI